jgi:hypothetical protein
MKYFTVKVFDEKFGEVGEFLVPTDLVEDNLVSLNRQLEHWGEEPTKIANAALWSLAPEVCHFDCDHCRA